MSLADSDRHYAQIIWDYMFLHQPAAKSDVIIGLGCHDLSVADDAAGLFKRGIAPLIVFSGNVGRMTEGVFDEPESERMRSRAVGSGVPASNILVEIESRNTGENIRYTQQLLKSLGMRPSSVTLVHKPYMLRRDYATFMKQWDGADSVSVRCWAEPITMEEYLDKDSIGTRETISIMLGDLERIREYPGRGFQIQQDIPGEVWDAFEILVTRGYRHHLLDSRQP